MISLCACLVGHPELAGAQERRASQSLLDNLHRADFAAIPATEQTLADVLVINQTLADVKCSLHEPVDPRLQAEAQRAIDLIAKLSARGEPVVAQAWLLRTTRPLYAQTAAWVDASGGCHSDGAQRLMKNAVGLLARRAEPEAWGLGARRRR